jgi:AmiR/NasT family two-component response regulator
MAAHTPGPVLVVTDCEETGLVERALELGVEAVIAYPAQPSVVRREIARATGISREA